jgi:hypothetical protein
VILVVRLNSFNRKLRLTIVVAKFWTSFKQLSLDFIDLLTLNPHRNFTKSSNDSVASVDLLPVINPHLVPWKNRAEYYFSYRMQDNTSLILMQRKIHLALLAFEPIALFLFPSNPGQTTIKIPIGKSPYHKKCN